MKVTDNKSLISKACDILVQQSPIYPDYTEYLDHLVLTLEFSFGRRLLTI